MTLPYLLIMIGFTVAIALLPDIALWLPRYLAN
jgi:C4-dicarboxylate transporter, DctM subunit